MPMYNGPISTTIEHRVAKQFSELNGLVWTIQPSYNNKFKLVLGISVEWISCFKDESEVLLMNQYLPIQSTHTFQNDTDNQIDFLLETIKSYKQKIENNQPKSETEP